MRWDPVQYERFAAERARPFHDLVARVGAEHPRRVVDLGCGTGALTALLAQRWPEARIEGIDASPEMIVAAERLETTVRFALGDVAEWQQPADADVLVTNAVLQWVPAHRDLLARWAAALPAGGWLAMQVPGNFAAPAHTLLRELAGSATWRGSLGGVLRHDWVDTPSAYAELMLAAGLAADVWETTYVHVLAGAEAVLEWLRGTGLRPVLAALAPADAERFSDELAGELRAAYPETEHGTLMPFRRVFAVGQRT